MSVLNKLFTKSPFSQIQAHMEKVSDCVQKLDEAFDALFKKNYKAINNISEEISILEHDADLIKNEIRNNLPRGLFLQVNRADLLEILSLQDTIADRAEDISIQLTLKKLEPIGSIEKDIKAVLDKNTEAFNQAFSIIHKLDELVESSFGGKEAEKVQELILQVAYTEHEVDILNKVILKKLYNMDKKLSYSSFHLWVSVLKSLSGISDTSEKLCNRVRMLLDVS